MTGLSTASTLPEAAGECMGYGGTPDIEIRLLRAVVPGAAWWCQHYFLTPDSTLGMATTQLV
jgi:hypothetical protein